MSFDRDEIGRQDSLRERVLNARESLDTELKPWFDPTSDYGRAQIARSCIAFRNFDGGQLIIGIKDDGAPDPNAPPNIPAAFFPDMVHDILTKHVSERFPVTVDYVEREGIDRVVVTVPPGIPTPVSATESIPRLVQNKQKAGSHLKAGAFYYRTLDANGRPSSAPASPKDWREIMTKCFNNREADVGAFLRRQLSGVDLGALASAIGAIVSQKTAPEPSDLAFRELERNYERYLQAMRESAPNSMGLATRDSAAVCIGDFEVPTLNERAMMQVGLAAPHLSGWAPYGSLLNIHARIGTPKYVQDGWEALYVSLNDRSNVVEFSRIEAAGTLYYIEVIRDDMCPYEAPNWRSFEWTMEIARVGEVIIDTLEMAKRLTGKADQLDVAFAFRWKGLEGRRLSSWSNPNRDVHSSAVAAEDEARSFARIPIETPHDSIGTFVANLVRPLFLRFGGREFSLEVITSILSERLGRIVR